MTWRPESQAMSRDLPRLTRCQNCGTPAPGNYCPECGQDSRDHVVSLRVLLGDFLGDVFTFDSRFFRSMVPLVIRPGRLTVEYIEGRRVRYIPPLRLFFFVTILFFFVLAIRVNPMLDDLPGTGAGADSVATPDSVATADSSGGRDLPARADSLTGTTSDADRDSAVTADSTASASTTPRLTYMGEDITDESDQIFKTALKIGPKAVFLLFPFFAAYLALIYIRMRRLLIEHLVFSLHYHALLFLLFSVAALIGKPLAWLLVPPVAGVYLLVAMRRVYAQGWRKTLIKHFLLTTAYNATFLLLVLLTIGSSAWLLRLSEHHPWILGWLN